MALTLYRKTHWRGKKQKISGNVADLGKTKVDRPSSLQLTSPRDAVLFFKKDRWRGSVLYVRGSRGVSDLGNPKKGGRISFSNSIRSSRQTPFQIDLNVTIVLNGIGELPVGLIDREFTRAWVKKIVTDSNAWLAGQRALLETRLARITFRVSNDMFHCNAHSPIPPGWKVKGEVDIAILHSFHQSGAVGVAKFPFLGRHFKLAKIINYIDGKNEHVTQDLMTEAFLHELGHYFGLQHRSAKGIPRNIMARSPVPNTTFWDKNLSTAQIREIHQKLARNLTRRKDRK